MVAALDLVGDVAPRRFVHGDVIAHQGEPVTALSLVTAGVVRLSAVTSNGREVVVGLVGAGQLFGETSLLAPGDPSPVEARAVGTATVIQVPESSLRAVLERSPAAAGEIVRFIAARLHRTSEALQDALTLDVTSRVSLRLRELARDHGRPEPDGVHIRIPITQEELARMVGASREAVNRTLTKLVEVGLVRTENRWLVVPDPDRLERVTGAAGHGPRRPAIVSRIPGGG